MSNKNPDFNKTFEQLIEENINFVYSVVNNEFKQYPWSIKEDLYSAGKAGLVYAATKYNSSEYSNKFISYAVHWIRYYIKEEIRNLYPVKLNQNFVYKRTKINNYIKEYKESHAGKTPTFDQISGALGLSKKVIGNILNVNHGENFHFISLQAQTSDSANDEAYVENKLINEYLEETITEQDLTHFELDDLLSVLKTKISERDFNIFYEKYINGLSYSEIAKKYKLNFPSSAKYIITQVEKTCKEILM